MRHGLTVVAVTLTGMEASVAEQWAVTEKV